MCPTTFKSSLAQIITTSITSPDSHSIGTMIASRLPLQAIDETVFDSVVQSFSKQGSAKSSSQATKRGTQSSAGAKKLTQELRGIIENYVSDEAMRNRAMDILTELGLSTASATVMSTPTPSSSSTATAVADATAAASTTTATSTGFTIFAESNPQQSSSSSVQPTPVSVSGSVSVPMSVESDATGQTQGQGQPMMRAIRRSARRASLAAGALVPLSVLEQLQPQPQPQLQPQFVLREDVPVAASSDQCAVKDKEATAETREVNGKRTRSKKALVSAAGEVKSEVMATAVPTQETEQPMVVPAEDVTVEDASRSNSSSSSSYDNNNGSNSYDSSADHPTISGSAHKAPRTAEMCSPATNRLRSQR